MNYEYYRALLREASNEFFSEQTVQKSFANDFGVKAGGIYSLEGTNLNSEEVSAPKVHMVVLIDREICDDGIQTSGSKRWWAWTCSKHTELASMFDVLLEIEVPDPCAMVNVWNRIVINEDLIVNQLSVLNDTEFSNVRAVWAEFCINGGTATDIEAAIGHTGLRDTMYDRSVVTGTPIGGEDDSRYAYQQLVQDISQQVTKLSRLNCGEAVVATKGPVVVDDLDVVVPIRNIAAIEELPDLANVADDHSDSLTDLSNLSTTVEIGRYKGIAFCSYCGTLIVGSNDELVSLVIDGEAVPLTPTGNDAVVTEPDFHYWYELSLDWLDAIHEILYREKDMEVILS